MAQWSNQLVIMVSTPWFPNLDNQLWLATTLLSRSLVKVSSLCLLDQVYLCSLYPRSKRPLVSRARFKTSIWAIGHNLSPTFSSWDDFQTKAKFDPTFSYKSVRMNQMGQVHFYVGLILSKDRLIDYDYKNLKTILLIFKLWLYL